MVHIGIIPDGNRRWAKQNKYDINYVIGNLKNLLIKIINLVSDNKQIHEYKHINKITEVSIYALSEDNYTKRKDSTIIMIEEMLNIMYEYIPDDIYNKIKIQFIGEIKNLPESMYNLCKNIELKCNKESNFIISIAMCYNPIKDISYIINNDRCHQTDIDLIIRTGKEIRTSGFFPIQSINSELYFTDILFPDFTISDLDIAMNEYFKRERRFGA